MKRNRLFAAFIATLSVTFISLAHADPKKVLEPFVDEQMIAVVRIDLRRVDAKALEAWVVETVRAGVPKADPTVGKQAELAVAELAGPRAEMEKLLKSFADAGGQEMYVLLTTQELAAQGPPTVLVPIAKGADANKLEAVFGPPGAPQQGPRMSKRIGDVLVLGNESVQARLQALHDDKSKRAENAELFTALEKGAPDASVQLAIAPSAEARRVFQELAPNLPPELGGGSSETLTRGLRWAAVSIKLPPKPSANVTIQAQDAASAAELDKMIRAALDAAAKAIQAEAANAPKGDAELLRMLVQLLPKLAPTPKGERLVLAITEADFRQLSGTLTTGVVRARENAMRAQSLANIRQLVLVGHMWSAEHKGEWPDDIKEAMKKYDVAEQQAVNPRNPKTGYTYVKPAKGEKDAARRIVLYETADDPEGRNAGFMDGHAEWMTADEFKKALAAQEERDKKADEKK